MPCFAHENARIHGRNHSHRVARNNLLHVVQRNTRPGLQWLFWASSFMEEGWELGWGVGSETLSGPLLAAAGVTPPSPDHNATAPTKPGKHHVSTPAWIPGEPLPLPITIHETQWTSHTVFVARSLPPVPGWPRTLWTPTAGTFQAMA